MARSSEEIQWAMMTKHRRRRLNRCRPYNALDAHRRDPGDGKGGAQQVGKQKHKTTISIAGTYPSHGGKAYTEYNWRVSLC